MKKVIVVIISMSMTLLSFSQSEKYIQAMQKLVPAVDTTREASKLLEISNSFERIAEAEKTQWLPYYYAALTRINYGFTVIDMSNIMEAKADKVDPIGDKVKVLLAKADELSKNNSEIYVVKKLLYSFYMLGDVMNRYMTDGEEARKALETAKQLNPENPRVYLQEGIDLFNTPEQFGGSKQGGKRKLEEAIKKFESFKPESNIHPSWGLATASYFLQQ